MNEDQKNKDLSSETCSKSLFPSPTSQSRCGPKENANMEEAQVQQGRKSDEATDVVKEKKEMQN